MVRLPWHHEHDPWLRQVLSKRFERRYGRLRSLPCAMPLSRDTLALLVFRLFVAAAQAALFGRRLARAVCRVVFLNRVSADAWSHCYLSKRIGHVQVRPRFLSSKNSACLGCS